MPVSKRKITDDKSFYEARIISTFPSRYHSWFRELNYPMLDIAEYSDGSWSIINYLSSLATPTPLMKWQMVLGYMLNIIPTFGFVEKYVKRVDLQRKEFWDQEEKKTKEVEREHEALEKHRDDMVNRAHHLFTHTPEVMERIAKNGAIEMNLDRLARHIPDSVLFKPKWKGEKVSTIGKDSANVEVHYPSKPSEQAVSTSVPSPVQKGL